MKRKTVQRYLNYLRNRFSNILINSTNEEEKLKANKAIDSIDQVLSNMEFHIAIPQRKEHYMNILENDLILLDKYSSYWPCIRLLQSFNDLIEVHYRPLSKFSINNEELLETTNDFYSQIGEPFSEKYKEVAATYFKTLLFNSSLLTGASSSTSCIYGTKISFVSIYKSHTINDYLSMAHETSHCISNRMNPYSIWDKEKYCFGEVDALFFEMLNLDYLEKEKGLNEEALKSRMLIFKDYLYFADILGTKIDLLNELSPFKLADKRKLVKYLKECGYNNRAIKDILYEKASNLFNYIISYLVAIELYFIYETDKDLALTLLNKIIICKKNSSHEYLDYVQSLGIDIGSSVDTYIGHLMNQSKEGNYIYEKKF